MGCEACLLFSVSLDDRSVLGLWQVFLEGFFRLVFWVLEEVDEFACGGCALGRDLRILKKDTPKF